MRVLVTGATGFIGGHLVRELRDQGDEVRCLVRASSDRTDLEPLDVEFAVGDIGDPASLSAAVGGVDAVVHLASLLKKPWAREFNQINAGGAANVVDACAGLETPPLVVNISSLAAAGPAEAGVPVTEARPPAPISIYGKAKLGGETAMLERAADVPVSIIRPPAVFGPRDRTSLGLFRTANRGFHVVPHRGRFDLSLVDARELSRAIAMVMRDGERADGNSHATGTGIYFAAHPEPIAYADFGRAVGRALGRDRIRVLRVPRYFMGATCAVSEGLGRITGRSTFLSLDKYREATAGSWVCATDKIESLGFAHAPLEPGFADAADWYRQAGWL